MSLLTLLDSHSATASADTSSRRGLLRAMLDAIHKEDDRIGGRAVTRLLRPLVPGDSFAEVESTIGFGENNDGANDAKFLVNGELITSSGRTSALPYKFTTLTRALENTTEKTHPVGSLVYDMSRNVSGLDRLWRGLLVDYAIGSDLDVIGRNLGLDKCPGLTDEQWRRIIKAVAYLPKQTIDAFEKALEALLGNTDDFLVYERLVSDPWKVFVEIAVQNSETLRGRMVLNGGEPQLTTGLTTVLSTYPVIQSPFAAYPGFTSLVAGNRTLVYPASGAGTKVAGVFLDTPSARRGNRAGLTNYFASAVGNVITLSPSPGPIGTAVLIDYTAFAAHYLPHDESVRDADDYWAYLADPLLTARCVLDHVRAAGVQVELSTKL